MKTVKLEMTLTSCKGCPWRDFPRWWCRKADLPLDGIADVILPEWCPLPDVEEVSDAE